MSQPSEAELKLTIKPLRLPGEYSSILLVLTDKNRSDLPPEEAIIAEARRVLQTTHSWKQGRTYFKTVKTYRGKLPEDGEPWHCRVSEHGEEDGSFDLLWEKLGTVKEAHEKEWVSPHRSFYYVA
jgi:hypothetical protein